MSQPYTYRLYHLSTKKHYYGCRYSKNCNPNDLWVTYFTSSKIVHKLIKEFGKNSFIIKRIKNFSTVKAARIWEEKFLRRIDAARNSDWINLHNGGKGFYNIDNSNWIGKEHKIESKIKMGETKRKNGFVPWNKGVKYAEIKENYVHPWQGRQHTQEALDKMNGRKLSPEQIENIKANHKGMTGKTQLRLTCPHCHKTGGNGAMPRWHFDNCKFKSNFPLISMT